jgi:hypothetical protein
MLEDREAEAQKVLDQLWHEQLLPFALTVGKITKDSHEYTIHFHDSRIRTARVSLSEGQPFTDGVRSSVLDRVARMSGPLNNEKVAAAKTGS